MNNNNNEQHLSTAELAGLAGMPTSVYGVRKRADKQAWPWRQRTGRGGGREYPISSLPPETQAAIAGHAIAGGAPDSAAGLTAARHRAGAGAREAQASRAESIAMMFDAKPEKLKAEARARLDLVNEYHRLQGRGFDRAAVVAALKCEHGISEATLARYVGLVRGEPEHTWLFLLCPAYAGRTATAGLSAEAWEVLKADYLRPERPTASACIFRLKRAARERGWTVPSDRTLLRRLDKLPRAVKVLAREGKQAALQLYPAQARSKAALQALQIINADGYKHNVWVKFPDGEVLRAKTWFWQDVYSSRVIGWRTDKTEHTDMIRLSFGDVVERYGIPDAVLLDNTLAAANKTMSGGIKHRFRFKVREEEPLGVFPLLNVNVMWATPRHGQAKPVERVFGIGGIGEIVDKAPELAGAWTGGNPLDKPEYDGKTRAIPLEQLEEVIEREVAAFNAREGRRSPIHQGRSFDAVFGESYERATIRRATEAQRRLWLLATEARTASRDGAITLEAGRISRSQVARTQANRYWHADLVDHAGRQVVARFDPRRLHEGVHVYTLDGRYLCFAECHAAQGFNDQIAAREHQRNRKIFMRGAKQLLVAERRMDALQAAKHLPGSEERKAAELTVPAPKVVRGEFRDPLERPRVVASERSVEESAELRALEAEMAATPVVNVHELRSDTDKHAHWRVLDERRAAGTTLADQEEQFWSAWQHSEYFRLDRELTQEFERRLASSG